MSREGVPAQPGLGGMCDRYGDPLPANAVERMEMELGVIDKMGFHAYS